jgi:hypothetical protein
MSAFFEYGEARSGVPDFKADFERQSRLARDFLAMRQHCLTGGLVGGWVRFVISHVARSGES